MLKYRNTKSRCRNGKAIAKTEVRQNGTPLPKQQHEALPHIIGCGVGLVVMGLVVAAGAASLAPAPGDILRFSQTSLPHGFVPIAIEAHELAGTFALPGTACTLDEKMMIASGGSLTVTEVRSAGVALSWTGGKTSAQAACPSGRQVLVSRSDYQMLSLITEERPNLMR